MIGLSIVLDGDGAWPELEDAKVGLLEGVGRLTKGTTSGNSSVGFKIKLEDGSYLFTQTSMRLFLAAAQAFQIAEERDHVPSEQDIPPYPGKMN